MSILRSTRRVLCTLGVFALATPAAFAAAPPPGTPDLAAMALQASDLAPGALAAHQGYVRPTAGFIAQYDGGFITASTPDGASYYSLGDYISISASASTVNRFFGAEKAFFLSAQGHRLLDGVIIAAAGRRAHLSDREIRYESGGTLGVGTASFLETIGLQTGSVDVHEDVVLFAQGTVYVLLIMTGDPGVTIPRADAGALATAIDGHINSVLAFGATGATGTTGSSG